MKNNLNWLDKIIASVDPEKGVRRAQARVGLQMYNAHEGAQRGRRNESNPRAGSANEDLKYDLETLRARARDLVRNTPHAAKACNSLQASIIGSGIIPKFRGDNAKPAQLLWDKFIDQCDMDWDTNFYGLQALAVRTMVESGEALILPRPVPSGFNLAIPLQLQVLEPDYIDSRKNVRDLGNGGYIINGIEFNQFGRKLAYWIYTQHPGDGRSLTSQRIAAADVIHLFEKKRPGQSRGTPWLSAVMAKIADLDDYDKAELFSKKIQACFTNFITTPNGDIASSLMGELSQDTATGEKREKMQPGMNIRLQPGESVTQSTPPITPGYADYKRNHLRDIAAGLGVTYEILTGDLSQVNYSSYRAGHIDFRARIEQLRAHTIIPQFCRQVFRRFESLADGLGLVAKGSYEVEWVPPRWQSIDPLTDNKADLLAIRAGLESPQQVMAEHGYDMDTMLDDQAEFAAGLDARKLILDSDPRNITLNGQMQPPINPNNPLGGN